jgi:spermine oxidase
MRTLPLPHKTVKVIVIGAGFAGLSAANSLRHGGLNAGKDFLVLEASSCVGGRARTLPISEELSVELGATWLHGVGTPGNPNPILAEAQAYGLMDSTPRPQKWWDSNFIIPGRAENLSKEEEVAVHVVVEAYNEALESIGEGSQGSVGNSLRAFMHEKFGAAMDPGIQHMPKHVGKDFENLGNAAWAWREKLQGAMDGCQSTHDMHAASRAAYEEWEGHDIHAPVPPGYQSIAEAMASRLGGEQGLLLNHEARLVKWDEHGVLVVCANGASFKASAAIVTTSLGVLKHRKDLADEAVELIQRNDDNLGRPKGSVMDVIAQGTFGFCPPLPPDIREAINRLSIGIVDKVFVLFDDAHEGKGDDPIDTPAAHTNYTVDDSGALPGEETRGHDTSLPGSLGVQERTVVAFEEPDAGVVTWSLLWDATWADSAGGAFEGLPEWTRGIFSIRFGGPEFKRRHRMRAEQIMSTTPPADCDERDGNVPPGTQSGGLDAKVGEDQEVDLETTNQRTPRHRECVIWLVGEAATAMEAATDSEVLTGIQGVIQRFPAIALPRGTNWQSAKLVRSCWGSDPFARGAYSYVTATSSPQDVETLAKGVEMPDGNGNSRLVVAFAGEACHVRYIGTTHGAWETGHSAAQRVLNELQ